MGWKPSLATLLLAAALHADTAVPRAGTVLRGALVVDEKGGTLRQGETTHSLRDFLLVENDDGTLVWSAGIRERLEAYAHLVVLARRPRIVDLTKRAVRARDHVTARRLFEWARREGLRDRDERILRKRVEKLEKKPRKMDEKKRPAILAEEKRLQAALPDLLLARARKNEADRLHLLRALLDEVPGHEAALELVRPRVPKGTPFSEPRDWLAWHLDVERRGFAIADPDLMEIRRARHHWRPDLYGVTSKEMLLVTPLRDARLVSACALRIRITIDTLERLFQSDQPLERTRQPLTVHLFVNRRNFAERAGYNGAVDVPPYYRWSLGHFDYRKKLTRLLCHDRIKDPENRALAYTLVHEVARHWLTSYCPRFSGQEIFNAGPASGYGLRTGFVTFLAEARYDLANGKVDFAHRDTTSLRYVAKDKVFPWGQFFLMNADDVHRMNGEDEELYKEKRKRTLRGHQFMFQGGATCHYFFNADGGRHRTALIDFVTHQFLGKQEKLNPRHVFGRPPDELGAAVLAWCRR